MIIGISGKKQHGKNTFAATAQFLIWQDKVQRGFASSENRVLQDFLYYPDLAALLSGWQQKMFAEKLKQIVALLLGCTVKDLENNTFKEKLLGPEWNRYYLAYYKARSGKNPLGRMSRLFSTYAEAQDYKNAKHGLDSLNEIIAECEVVTEVMTPRKILQLVGTDGGRDIVHPDMWVNSTMVDYKDLSKVAHDGKRYVEIYGKAERREDGKRYIPGTDVMVIHDTYLTHKQVDGPTYPDWMMTDMRFPNETSAIKARGGVVVRVERLDLQAPPDEHESETALDHYNGWDFKFTRLKSGIDDEYVSQVKFALQELQILPRND